MNFLIRAFALFVICLTAKAQRISDLPVATTAADTNVTIIVTAPNAAGGTKQITISNLFVGRGGDASGTNSRQGGSLNLTNWSNIATGAMANIPSVTFFTNWANAISNLTTAVTNSASVTNWITARQPATASLTNWSNIPTGAMANVVAATFLTNWANAVSNLIAASDITTSNGAVDFTMAASNSLAVLTIAATNSMSVTGWINFRQLASQYLSNVVAAANGTGMLTNNGSGVLGWMSTWGNFSTNADGSASFTGAGVGSVKLYDNAQTEYFALEAPFNVQTNNVLRGLSNATAGVLVAEDVGTGTNQMRAVPGTIGQGVFYKADGTLGSSNAVTLELLNSASNILALATTAATNSALVTNWINFRQVASVYLSNLVAAANGTGMLTNDGSGVLGWMTIPSSGSAFPLGADANAAGFSITNIGKLSLSPTPDTGTQNPSIVLGGTNSAGTPQLARFRLTNNLITVDGGTNALYGATPPMQLSLAGALTIAGSIVNSGSSANTIQGVRFTTTSTTDGYQATSAGIFYWNTRAILRSPADGVVQFGNFAATDANALTAGGTTAAFPGLGRTNGDWVVFGADRAFSGGSTNRLLVHGGLAVGPAPATITNTLAASAALDFPSTVAGASADLPITVTGVTSNNCHISLSVPWQAASGGGIFTYYNSNDTVYVRFSNNSLTLAVDPTPATFSVLAFKTLQ